MRFRRNSGWNAEEIFVQANIGHNRSIEQRFFVSGTRINYTPSESVSDFDHDVPSDWISGEVAKRYFGPKDWVIVSCSGRYVEIFQHDYYKKYNTPGKKPYISKQGVISWMVDPSTSAHIHKDYVASSADNSVFYMNSVKKWKDMIFTDHSHYWLNDQAVMVRHDVNIFTGESYDMLWSALDFKEGVLESVQPTKKNHCVINGRYIINTRNPEVWQVLP